MPGALVLKRVFDVVVAGVLSVVTLPLLVGIAWAVYKDSSGPVLFKQTRIGQEGKPFIMWKFRTMRLGAEREWIPPSSEDLSHYKFQDVGDPRITKVGKWLRQSSLDELPQLYNVLMGDMSLVGPRPEIPEMVALYTPDMHQRHRMKPGLTGLAQVSGRGDLSTAESIRWDLDYVNHWNLWLDLKILWWTLGIVVRRQGAQ